ncbi:MAG: ATP-binding protein [Bacteroidota bacterium]
MLTTGDMRFYFLLFVLQVGLWQSSHFYAQAVSYPKLVPGYYENFRDYRTYPSVCIEDAFVDSNGRLWLSTCKSANTANIHLYQFDGYKFKLVKGELSQLNHLSRIIGFTQKNEVVGTFEERNETQIFFFDLVSETISFLPIPENGYLTELTVSEDGRVFCIVELKGSLFFYEFVDQKPVLINQIAARYQVQIENDFYTPTACFVNGETFWQAPQNMEYIERIQVNTNSTNPTKIGIPQSKRPIQFSPYSKTFFEPIIQSKDTIYFKFYSPKNTYNLFKITTSGSSFNKVDFIPDSWNKIFIKKDWVGNLVFYNSRNYEGGRQAILLAVDGKLYDYKAFFAVDDAVNINAAVSKDYRKEVILCSPRDLSFLKVKSTDAIQNYLTNLSFRSMIEYDDQKYLLTTQNHPRFIFDGKTRSITEIDMGECSLPSQSLTLDKEGYIWGFNSQNLIKYDPETNTCELFPTGDEKNTTHEFLSNNRIAIVKRQKQLAIYNITTRELEYFKVDDIPMEFDGFVHEMVFGKDEILWAATTGGLYKIDLNQGTYKVFGTEPPFTNSRFLCLSQDEKGRLWLGTPNNGLQIYDPISNDLKTLNSDNGLANNTVASIVADDEGNRWLGTYNGVAMVSPEGDLITNLSVEDGIVEAESNRYAKLKGSDGSIFIGTIKGLSVIHPTLIKEGMQSSSDLKVYLTGIEYFDKNKKENVLLENGLSRVENIQLPADKRTFRISFANSNYFKPEENKYSYQIEGLDKDWIDIGNQNSLIVNRIPAGKHRLLLRSTDGIGNWTQEPLILNIRAKEFFYRQIWFYLVCILAFVGGAFLWIRNLRIQVQKATSQIQKDKATIEEQAEKLQELDKAKSKFFTNISHEFRTPLTIIYGIIDQMVAKPDAWMDKGAKMIKQNTANLLNLVNQILDLRKLESEKLQLDLQRGDIVSYIRYTFESFDSLASSKGIKLHYLSEVDALEMNFDKDKMLRILSNLLSNAINYTPAGGNVYLLINQAEDDLLKISLKDTGKGIPEDQLSHIFDRFFQADTTSSKAKEGTGIGLALTAELVKLFGGNIEVESEVGQGTRFTINLPIDQNFDESEPAATSSQPTESELARVGIDPLAVAETAIKLPLNTTEASGEKPLLLLVEDNRDVMQFLIASLEDTYQLIIAEDGHIGYEKAIEAIPDLIVSDVMMPEKDGFELCNDLKNDERTSHIPIVLLTAKADAESKLTGLRYGADAYLTKPFSQEELFVRLEKLHQLRLQLRARFSKLVKDLSEEKPSEELPELTHKESEFLQRLRKSIEDNISDENFGIAELCEVAKMSRAQLHRKLKSLTNLSASYFIRSIRLQKAKELLRSGDLNVTEVAYQVGIPNPGYFSRIFSQEFGVTPSEILKQ